MAGTVKLEDKQRLAQEEESEAKRLAIMMMKKREKYLYNKIMFGKRRKIREVSPCHLQAVAPQVSSEASRLAGHLWASPARLPPGPAHLLRPLPACVGMASASRLPLAVGESAGVWGQICLGTRPAFMKDH